jgi:uncharacterized protein (TIGR02449 family)
MDKEIRHVPALSALEQNINDMLSDYQRLRQENRDLRAQLAARVDDVAKLNMRLNNAAQKLETLIRHLPAE